MRKTILLADDSSTIRKIVELTFNDSDIRVELAESGVDALALLARIEVDLILADVVMPGPSGYEICRQVKQSDRVVPVVLLSSTFEPFDADLAAQCGADRHLVKPFESSALRETVRELLKQGAAAAPLTSSYDETDEAVDALIEPSEDPALEPSAPVGDVAASTPAVGGEDLDERLIEAVSRAVVRRLSEEVVREIAREIVPDLAERIIRERIRQLENEES